VAVKLSLCHQFRRICSNESNKKAVRNTGPKMWYTPVFVRVCLNTIGRSFDAGCCEGNSDEPQHVAHVRDSELIEVPPRVNVPRFLVESVV
jgi:hypothetical protein